MLISKPACRKCNKLLNGLDVAAIPSQKYCVVCGCRVYRYVIGQLSEQIEALQKKLNSKQSNKRKEVEADDRVTA